MASNCHSRLSFFLTPPLSKKNKKIGSNTLSVYCIYRLLLGHVPGISTVRIIYTPDYRSLPNGLFILMSQGGV